jgi:putative PIN family toxin of toxin-antitoxin system
MENTILDTNVIVSALRSNQGASFRLLMLVGTGRFDISLSVPLVLEYEDVLKRQAGAAIALSEQEIDDVLDYLCKVAQRQAVYYLWRPVLRDPHDDMVIEAALSAGCSCIVTYNLDDFRNVASFGISVIPPKVFLQRIGVLP